jgi:hypothetical protein
VDNLCVLGVDHCQYRYRRSQFSAEPNRAIRFAPVELAGSFFIGAMWWQQSLWKLPPDYSRLQ